MRIARHAMAAMMDLTLGGYLRRLRAISDEFVRIGGAELTRRRRRGGGKRSVAELPDDRGRIDGLMACAMHRLSMLGTAVGSTAARVAEAVRRKLVGRDRVALAHSPKQGQPSAGDRSTSGYPVGTLVNICRESGTRFMVV